LKEGKICPIKRKFFVLSAYFLFAIIQFSKQKTICRLKKYWEGIWGGHLPCFARPPPKVTPMDTAVYHSAVKFIRTKESHVANISTKRYCYRTD
jgi:hypothetical protein